MPSRPVVAAALAVVAAALVAGMLTFPAALEPGRSERDGITLEAALGADWFPGSAETVIVPRQRDGVRLESNRPGLLLVTRGLAIVPDRCYEARLEARALSGGVRVAIFDESLDRQIGVRGVPVTPRVAGHPLRFEADGRRRVSVAVLGTRESRVDVRGLALTPVACEVP